jgi:hypothetical protein
LFLNFYLIIFFSSQVAKVTAKLGEEHELLDRLLARYHELYVSTERWMRRQSFSLLCGHLIRQPNSAVSPEIFAARLLPLLEHLAKDPVPNVRLAVAQSISHDVLAHGKHCKKFLNYNTSNLLSIKVEI